MTEEKEKYVMKQDKVNEKVTEMPNIQHKLSVSKDGKWLINTITITTIYPVDYATKVMKNDYKKQKEIEN